MTTDSTTYTTPSDQAAAEQAAVDAELQAIRLAELDEWVKANERMKKKFTILYTSRVRWLLDLARGESR